MVYSSCGGTFLHKAGDEAWDLFENLSDNSQQHATFSHIGTSRQIGNRGMYEVSKNVDLSVKVDALSKKLDELLALNTLPTNSPNIRDSHTQSIAKLEIQIGQLGNAINRRDEDKLHSHTVENPRANHHKQVKAVITLKNGKLIDNKVGKPIKDSKLNENKTEGIDIRTKIERKIEKELASFSNSKTLESSSMASYKPKVLQQSIEGLVRQFHSFARDVEKLEREKIVLQWRKELEKILEELIHPIIKDLMTICLLNDIITCRLTTLIHFMKVDFEEDHKLEVEEKAKVEEDIIDHMKRFQDMKHGVRIILDLIWTLLIN
ncbi:hypothetical protein M9H77_30119 [Catharanthus roseus]|uniref:Uncharacterized protein n=1 Tax=Catharanthus roseus TaxID=4058 RepID=A0ACB9ZWD1_CATRO|nr:hypothetical protein M9H77_30119 [Catharanthus roseus]